MCIRDSVEAAAGIEEARRAERFRPLDVDDGEPLRPRRHVRVGPYEVEIARVGDRGLAAGRPRPVPQVIASIPTRGPALKVAEGYKRDRPNDESGNQIGISNRLGARPFNQSELVRFYLKNNELFTVENLTPRVKK